MAAEGRGTGSGRTAEHQSLEAEGLQWSSLVGERWAGESSWEGVGGSRASLPRWCPGPAGVTASAPTIPSLRQEPGITAAKTEPGVTPGLQSPGRGTPVCWVSASGSACSPGRGHFADKKTVSKGLKTTGLPGSW